MRFDLIFRHRFMIPDPNSAFIRHFSPTPIVSLGYFCIFDPGKGPHYSIEGYRKI